MTDSYQLTWQGISIAIVHKPNWISVHDHVEVKANERLPITETGYRSIFVFAEVIDKAGGVAPFVTKMLDEAAQSKEWERHAEESKQTSLF